MRCGLIGQLWGDSLQEAGVDMSLEVELEGKAFQKAVTVYAKA